MSNKPELPQIAMQILNSPPAENPGISALVRRVLLELIGPSSAPGERQKRPMMEPSQAHLGNGSRATSDYEARIASQRHQKVSRISHAARDQDGARPVLEFDVIGRHDAYD